MTVIFLDIDGVLNDESTQDRIRHSRGIEDNKLKILKTIQSNAKADIVLISSWKDEPTDSFYRKYLVNKLAQHGISIAAETEEEHWSLRAIGIRDFMEKNNVDNFIILDDEEFCGYNDDDLRDHWIQTAETDMLTGQTFCGLKEKHISQAAAIFSGHDTKDRRE